MSPHDYLKDLHTEETLHSGRTLYEHLCKVEEILKICRCDKEVCLAGLYHSIYGTNAFTVITTTDREKVKEIIGDRAEFLVWLFCNANRPFCWFCGSNIVLKDGSFVSVDEKTLHDLQMIEGANLLEQKCGADLITTFTSIRVKGMKTVIEAHKVDGVKVCRSEEVHVCASCGYDLDEAELAADTCSDCGAPLKLRKSVSVWATSVPKAGAKTWGQT